MADTLKQVSDELAQVVETAGQSVVRVEARRRLPASGFVWSNDLIVTAHHVLERDENIKVGLHDGRTLSATLVGRDPNTDVAILRVDGGGLPSPVWVNNTDLKVGQLVLALGRPGANVQATLGVVSALGGDVDLEQGGGEEREERAGAGVGVVAGGRERASRLDQFIQTDVVMYPGFSGGPLVDAAGQIRGFNSSGFMRGISLTIPTAVISTVADQLLKHGKVRQGYLGIGAQPAKLPANLAQQLAQEMGLLVMSVEANSPAEQGGMMLGDVLVKFDGYSIESLEELLTLLNGGKIDTELPATVVRGGAVTELRVKVGERK